MDQQRIDQLNKVVQNVGMTDSLQDLNLLNQAFIHPTYAMERKLAPGADNQRLEFLGDAVLGLVVGELLYREYPQRAEGDLTSIRAVAVSEVTLSLLAREAGLSEFLLLGRGEEKTGGRYRASILADAFEAFLGALYLQMPFDELSSYITSVFRPVICQIIQSGYKDPKTQLQEMAQESHKKSVTYRVLEESGPDHDKTFTAAVVWEDEIIAVGRGKSKKEAERNAAEQAIHHFRV